MDIKALQSRMKRLVGSNMSSPEYTDHSIPEYCMGLLGQVALVENSSMTIYDIIQMKYVFVRIRFCELEVLGLITRGMAGKEIVKRSFMSDNTVKYHRQNIIEKMDVSPLEALAYSM